VTGLGRCGQVLNRCSTDLLEREVVGLFSLGEWDA
jgi:hypothetical protein